MRVNRRATLALALGLTACGGEASRVSISLGFDEDSCAIGDQAATPCDANVGFWLLDGRTGAVLEEACVDFSTGVRPYAQLPEVLSDEIEFGGVTAERVRVELALYSPARPGCPRVDDDGSQAEVYGRSAVVSLGEVPRIELSLTCSGGASSPDQPDDGVCQGLCEAQHDRCIEEILGGDPDGGRDCTDTYAGCVGACDDDPVCLDACVVGLQACQERNAECDAAEDACLEACSDPSC